MYGCSRDVPTGPGINRAQADATANAVMQFGPVDGILNEGLCPESEFYLDYAGGKGVFIRYLGYMSANSHPPVDKYNRFLLTNATAVWNNRSADGKFHYWWNLQSDGDIKWSYDTAVSDSVLHASGLAALTACLLNGIGEQVIPAVVTMEA